MLWARRTSLYLTTAGLEEHIKRAEEGTLPKDDQGNEPQYPTQEQLDQYKMMFEEAMKELDMVKETFDEYKEELKEKNPFFDELSDRQKETRDALEAIKAQRDEILKENKEKTEEADGEEVPQQIEL